MDRELKMHLVKRFVNLAVRFLDLIIPHARVCTPQSRMINHVFDRLDKVFRCEVYSGAIDDVPGQRLSNLKDRNFQRLLMVSRKLLTYFSENDRYYRQWLGLGMLLVEDEVKTELSRLSFEDFIVIMEVWWEMNLKGLSFLKARFEEDKSTFLNMALANYFMNLA
jgi:hypothetical protein